MKIVADTSTFLAVALDEPEKAQIIALTEGQELIAPEVLPFEVGNALTAMMRKGILEAEQIGAAWDAVQAVAVDLRPIEIRSALEIAAQLNIYAYDAYFLECALGLRCPLLTLDRRMERIAREIGVSIVQREEKKK